MANTSEVKVKVCGITRLQDAELAVELGAWALGMIFYEGSPRACSQEQALRIAAALRRRVELCGVFVNAPLEQVLATADGLGLTLLQLHGDEGPAYCAEAARRTGARVIKAVQVASVGEVRDLERFHVDYHLLDARARSAERRELRGGTGETFDWSLLQARRSRLPLILSGGLSAENVGAALAATAELGPAAQPFALDTASGTEAAPGRKDPERLRAFFAELAAAEAARAVAEESPAGDSAARAPITAASAG
ncbi:MAG TPA: phosphoribosylanthranilate isomerase [Solirubrobacteraceae bacterium]|nr:phosphoribosylanthranilate isomerase [Solirubrobacteraceae bacterium]